MADQKSSLQGWAQVAATMFLGVVGLIFTGVQNNQQEKSRVSQAASQLMSQREQSEINFREAIFKTIIEKLLEPTVLPKTKVTLMEVFENNFHDIFNGRALFEYLKEDVELNVTDPDDKERLIHRLISLARGVRRSQEQEISGEVKHIHLTIAKMSTDTLNFGEVLDPDGSGHVVEVTLLQMRSDTNAVKVHLVIKDIIKKDQEISEYFWVEYLDVPLTDNTLLHDRHRLAIVLDSARINGRSSYADLSLIEFPANYVTTGYRPQIQQIDEMLSHTAGSRGWWGNLFDVGGRDTHH